MTASPEVGLRSWRSQQSGYIEFQIAVLKTPDVKADEVAKETFDQIWYELQDAGVLLNVEKLFFRDRTAFSGVECSGYVSLHDYQRADAVFRKRSKQPWLPHSTEPQLPTGSNGKASGSTETSSS